MNTPAQAGWLAHIAVMLITTVLVILGFFFLTIALVAGALLAVVFGARLWWTLRKLKRAQPPLATTHDHHDAVEGEYQVVERESGVVHLPPQR